MTIRQHLQFYLRHKNVDLLPLKVSADYALQNENSCTPFEISILFFAMITGKSYFPSKYTHDNLDVFGLSGIE